jgi:hypothetical protein
MVADKLAAASDNRVEKTGYHSHPCQDPSGSKTSSTSVMAKGLHR